MIKIQGQGGKAPQQPWTAFLEKLQKDKNPLYELLKDSQLAEGTDLILYLPNEEAKAEAQQKIGQIKSKLVKLYSHWKDKRLTPIVGQLPSESNKLSLTPASARRENFQRLNTLGELPAIARSSNSQNSRPVRSPLQALNQTLFNEHSQPALEAAAAADNTCESIYAQLTKTTQRIADDVLNVKFSWRVRVGGTRGFRELLLPVFHPVYGVPYIPASSLKGAIRAWARERDAAEMQRLLGTLDDGVGCVQILDAFPIGSCLSVDMANPQWSWENNRVKYQPVPHPLLSMEEPEFAIGLAYTRRGKNVQNERRAQDLEKVKEWLEKALEAGLGSRVSAGYGRTGLTASLPHFSTYEFKLWTQGMYGADTKNPEFRPVALRGVLRYWFRALALGIYDVDTCQQLETELFGTLSKEGSIRIGVEYSQQESDRPLVYTGIILLEAKQEKHLLLIEKVLYLSSHLAGIGRGSRRPLHWNNPPGLRGCHWELASIMPSDRQTWKKFLQGAINAFTAVRPSTNNPGEGKPWLHGIRCQDVLNSEARIYLVPCQNLKHPKEVDNWPKEGVQCSVRGEALKLLYSSDSYKGEKKRDGQVIGGNKKVGGSLGTPSYVVIKSNFTAEDQPYQAVTIFGVDNSDRTAFVNALPSTSIKVWPLA